MNGVLSINPAPHEDIAPLEKVKTGTLSDRI
jgi:hypothetical protein